MPILEPRSVPPDEELRERAANALKGHPLFQNVSRRMLIDLVHKFDLKLADPVGTPPNPTLKRPVILVVLEGALRIDEPGPAMTTLTKGIYAAHERPLSGVAWMGATVHAVGDRTLRVFFLTLDQFANHLPRILVNAMDPIELSNLVLAL